MDVAADPEVRRLADQQAALRRVATLVAQDVRPAQIFTAVAEEVGRLFDLPWVGVMRYDPDDRFTVVSTWGEHPFPAGSRWPLDGPSTFESVWRTGRPARISDYSDLPGSVARAARGAGIVGGIGAPIVVERSIWGVIAAPVTADRAIPEGAEDELNEFTELVATAIANAESREALARLADEQAALRRVATLVARSAPPMEVFGAVTEELGRLFLGDFTYVTRFDSEDAVTVLAGWMATGELPMKLPGRWTAGPTSRAIHATRAPVRLDPYPRRSLVEDPETAVVAAPITVGGALWGFMTVASTNAERPPPPGTEARLSNFAELVATAISNAESREALGVLADEQAALRRVAVLVAQQPSPDEVFTAVTEAVGPLLGADLAAMHVFTADGTAMAVAGWSAEGPMVPVGTRLPLDGDSAVARIFHTGAAARIDSYVDVEGDTAEVARGLRLRSTVGAPIVVEGRLWGALMAATRGEDPLPQDAETRIAAFTELVATAVSNAESRAALGQLAGEQAALRRVATLVAEGVAPAEVFSAVSREVEQVLAFRMDNTATVVRFDAGPECVLVGASKPVSETPLGTRWQPNDHYVSTRVLRTGASARVDETDLAVGGFAAEQMRRQGYLSQVASPIVVEGRLWGAMTVSAAETLPSDTEARLEKFTQLVETAIANAESREALARLADEQAALRRVATLVASGVEPGPLFDAIAGEVEALFGVEISAVVRFEGDGTVTVMGAHGGPHSPGARVQLDPDYVVAAVYRTRQAARFDLEDWEGEPSGVVRDWGVRSALATPIVVEGELWGAITIASLAGALVAATERRLADFSALFATAIANTHAREQVTALAEEQAALRRVATLAARELAPVEVLVAVTEEAARALETEAVGMLRFEPDGSATLVAQSQTPWDPPPLGTRFTLEGENIVASVHRTGRAARMDDWANATGSVAAMAHVLGVRSAVATPIVVEGRLWGTMIAATSQSKPLPADIESRIGEFTELVATAIANAESREALGQLADEQAALRRVATLVAQGVPSPELFSAVTKEVEHVFSGVEPSLVATVIRFDPGPECVLVGASRSYEQEPIGSRWAPKELYVSARVLRTGQPARVDEADLEALGGPDADVLRLRGFLHQVGSPVLVEGRLWGAMTLNSKEVLPPDVDRRLVSFTELVATAIANAESQSELAASRRRIVAASDDTRRRIERDLHDGIQQQLVSLGMELGELEASLPAGGELKPQVAGVTSGLRAAIDDLREISRGIHPAILAHGGLSTALKTLARRSSVPVRLNAAIDGRLPERVEVAAYYVASEALTNVARHARASVVSIDVVELNGRLELSIRDDGVGGADPRGGTGLIGLKDRVEALDGEIGVESPPGHGTSLVVSFPLGGEPEVESLQH